jgi:hypothetical protein
MARALRNHQGTLDTAIDAAYHAACDPGAWGECLRAASAIVGSTVAGLVVQNVASGQVKFGGSFNAPDEMLREYEREFHQIDPWPEAYSSARKLDWSVFPSEALMPERRFVNSAYYYDYMRRYDDIRHTIGAFGYIDPEHIVCLALPRSRALGPYSC